MTITIDLTDSEAHDWLHRASNGDTVDIWERMKADERWERAMEAQVSALVDYLRSDEVEVGGGEVDKETARTLLESFDEEEMRDIRRAAINRESDTDFLDRTVAEVVERIAD